MRAALGTRAGTGFAARFVAAQGGFVARAPATRTGRSGAGRATARARSAGTATRCASARIARGSRTALFTGGAAAGGILHAPRVPVKQVPGIARSAAPRGVLLEAGAGIATGALRGISGGRNGLVGVAPGALGANGTRSTTTRAGSAAARTGSPAGPRLGSRLEAGA